MPRLGSAMPHSSSPVLLRLGLTFFLASILLAPFAVAELAITFVSGCTDVGSTTTQCVRPIRLTIGGSDFLINTQPGTWRFNPLVGVSTTTNATYASRSQADCQVDRDTVTNTSLECVLPIAGGFNLLDFDTLLNVSYNDQAGGRSRPFPGVSFRALPTPRITRIEGCATVSDDGLTTFGCVPTGSTITLTGSDFSSLNGTDFNIYVGTAGTTVYLSPNSDPASYSDTRLTFTLASSYNTLLVEEQYDGAPIPLVLGQLSSDYNGYTYRQQWSTNTVYVQFAPLPPPDIASITADNQCSVDANGQLTQCLPGRARLSLTGHYLYPGLMVAVGGVQATVEYSRVLYAAFILPLAHFDPIQRYDLVVTTAAGSTTSPAAVSFTGSPVIASVEPCIDTGTFSLSSSSSLDCLGGERLTMHVVNFNFTALSSVSFSTYYDPPIPCTDVQPSPSDPLIATCTVPQRSVNWTTSRSDSSLTAYFDTARGAGAGGIVQSNTINHLWVWDWPISPRIASVVGCSTTATSATLLNLTQCMGGEVLTMTGTSFNQSKLTAKFTANGKFLCQPIFIFNDSMLSCELPAIDSSFFYGQPYQLTLNGNYQDKNNNPNPLQSNGVYVTFLSELPPLPPPPSTSSTGSPAPVDPAGAADTASSDSRTVAIVVPVVVVGVLLLLCCALMAVKRNTLFARLKESQSTSHVAGNRTRNSTDRVEMLIIEQGRSHVEPSVVNRD